MRESVRGQSPEGRHCLRTTSLSSRTPTAQQVVHFGPLSLDRAVAVHRSAVSRHARKLQTRRRRKRLRPDAIGKTRGDLCRSRLLQIPTALTIVDRAPVPVAVAGTCAVAAVTRRARNRHREASRGRGPSLVRRAPDTVYVSKPLPFPTAIGNHLSPRAVQRALSPNVAKEVISTRLVRHHASDCLRPVAVHRAEALDWSSSSLAIPTTRRLVSGSPRAVRSTHASAHSRDSGSAGELALRVHVGAWPDSIFRTCRNLHASTHVHVGPCAVERARTRHVSGEMLAASHVYRHAARGGLKAGHRRAENAFYRSPFRSDNTAVRIVHLAPLTRLATVAILIARVARRTHAHKRGANRRVVPLRVRTAAHVVAVRVIDTFPRAAHATGTGRLSKLSRATGTRYCKTRECSFPHALLRTVDLFCRMKRAPFAYGRQSSWLRARCRRSSSTG